MKKENFDKKQIILAVIILLLAIILLVYGFSSDKAENKPVATTTGANVSENVTEAKNDQGVTLNFAIEMKEDSEFQVYYTTEKDEEFSEGKSVSIQGKKGENQYEAALPAKEVVYIRLKIKSAQEHITLKSMYVTGAQEATLNEIPYYEMYQFDKIKINEDGSLTFNTLDDDAYLSYYKDVREAVKENQELLKEIPPVLEPEEAPILAPEDAPVIELEEEAAAEIKTVPAPTKENNKE